MWHINMKALMLFYKIPRLDILGKLLSLWHYHVRAGDEIHGKENIYNLRA
jgi:hypothetical protein